MDKEKFLGLIVTVSVSLYFFFSDLFEKVFYKYIAGPILADAKGVGEVVFGGYMAKPGYNIFNEFLYASLVALAAYFLYKEVKKRGFGMDHFYGLSLFAVSGGIMRVLEDAAVIDYPFNILVISPIGYFLVLFIAYLVYRASLFFEPVKRKYFLYGMGLFSVFAVSLPLFLALDGFAEGSFSLFLVSVSVVLGVLFLQKIISLFVKNSLMDSVSGYFVSAGHSLDGITSAFSIAEMGYGEKHPFSQLVMDITGSPYGFTVFKVLLVFGFMSFLSADMEDSERLLVLGVTGVGLGPGVRNLVRAVLGV